MEQALIGKRVRIEAGSAHINYTPYSKRGVNWKGEAYQKECTKSNQYYRQKQMDCISVHIIRKDRQSEEDIVSQNTF